MTDQLKVASGAPGPVEAEPAAEEGLFSGRYASVTTGFAVVMFLTGFAALAVMPVLPAAARDLDGVSLYPLVAGCFVAASLLGGVLGGYWADRAGARRPLAAGVVLSVATLLVSATSGSVWQLAAGRFLDGLAGGMVAVAVNTAVAQAYPERLRARVLALMSTCWLVPSLVGPPLAALVVTWWSWRAVFFGLAALTVLPAVAVVVLLRGRAWRAAPPPAEDRPPRPALTVALAVSVGAALGQYGVSGWDTRRLLCAVAGLALMAVFVARLLPPGTWRAGRGLPATALLRGLSSGAFFTLEAFVPLFLISDASVPAVVTGLAFTGAAVGWAASSWVQAHVLAHWPRHRLVVTGALVMALAAVLAVVGTLPAAHPYVAASAMVVAALGMGLLAPSVTLLSLVHSTPGRQGYASSALQTTQNLGQIAVLGLGSALFNGFLAAGAGDAAYGAVFGMLVVPSVLTALLAARARGDRLPGPSGGRKPTVPSGG